MTRSRTPRTQAPPLADAIRSALAQGWHSLATLDALAGGTVSTRRARVHAALAELAAAGVAREERMGSTGAEVRLAPVTLPAPTPDDGSGEWEPALICSECGEAHEADDRHGRPFAPHLRDAFERAADASSALAAGPVEADGDAYSDGIAPLSPEAMAVFVDLVEHPPAPTEALRALYAGAPGPSSRCAVCSAPHARHTPDDGHAFTPKPRGRPRVAAAPIPNAAPAVLPRARQRRERGPVVDVDGGRVERFRSRATPETRALLDAVCDEADARLAAVTEPETSRGGSDARALYEAIKSAGPTRVTLADGSAPNAGAEPVYMAEEERRLLPRAQCPSVWHDERCEREAGHPCGSADAEGRHHETADRATMWTNDAAERWASRATKPRARHRDAPDARRAAPQRCRPPACHRDDIHEPSRLRGFDRPLCEAHRRWVEEAGGTVAGVVGTT